MQYKFILTPILLISLQSEAILHNPTSRSVTAARKHLSTGRYDKALEKLMELSLLNPANMHIIGLLEALYPHVLQDPENRVSFVLDRYIRQLPNNRQALTLRATIEEARKQMQLPPEEALQALAEEFDKLNEELYWDPKWADFAALSPSRRTEAAKYLASLDRRMELLPKINRNVEWIDEAERRLQQALMEERSVEALQVLGQILAKHPKHLTALTKKIMVWLDLKDNAPTAYTVARELIDQDAGNKSVVDLEALLQAKLAWLSDHGVKYPWCFIQSTPDFLYKVSHRMPRTIMAWKRREAAESATLPSQEQHLKDRVAGLASPPKLIQICESEMFGVSERSPDLRLVHD